MTDINAQMADLLRADDRSAFGYFQFNALEDWFVANIAFAVDNCPKLFEYWKDKTAYLNRALAFAALSHACEGSSDDERLSILRGASPRPSHQALLRVLQDAPGNWQCFSPLWIGKEGSPLRDQALSMGWESKFIVAMTRDHKHNPNAHLWQPRMIFEQSLLAFGGLLMSNMVEQSALPKDQKVVISSCSKPDSHSLDVALAQSILASASPCWQVLERHPDVPEVSAAVKTHLDGLVQMHHAMGMMNDLEVSLCLGILPGGLPGEQLAVYSLPSPDND